MLYTMNDALCVAKEHHFAIPAFNISSLPIFLSVIQTAEALQAPVIVEVHPDELRYVTPPFVETMKKAARDASVPVVLHLDHGGCFEDVKLAVACGFTSVMIDGSTLPFEENVLQTQRVCEFAHEVGVSVEAELGTIGQIGTAMEGGTTKIIYTDPLQAALFVERTGIDSLAVAIGTAHGIYPKGFVPKLQLDLLKEIQNTVSVPLVLHGGSSNDDKEVEEAVRIAISKVNISSDVKSAFFKKLREVLREHPDWYEPNQIYPSCMEAASEVITHKIRLFHADGKCELYQN